MPYGEPIRCFRGHSPIKISPIAFAHRPKISHRLGEIQRWRLRNARNPAAHKGNGPSQQYKKMREELPHRQNNKIIR